jgi:hypothetical protein
MPTFPPSSTPPPAAAPEAVPVAPEVVAPVVPVPIAYGLDRSSARLILAQSQHGNAAQILFDGPPDAPEAAAALDRARADVTAGRAALAIAAPAESTFVRTVQTPISSPGKVARIWKSLLDLDLPFPVEQAATYAAPPRPMPGGGLSVLAAAIRADALQGLLDDSEAAGIPVTHVDAMAPALYDALTRVLPPARADAERAVVWIGPGSVVVARGRGADFQRAHLWRTSPLGPGAVEPFLTAWRTRAATYLECPAGDPPPPLDVYFAGPGAADADLVSRLTALLPPGIRTSAVPHPSAFLAQALAVRAAKGETWQLRSPPIPPHPAWLARTGGLVRRAAAVAALLAVLVIVLDAAILWRRHACLSGLADDIAKTAAPLSAIPLPKGQELVRLRPMLEESQSSFDTLSCLTAPVAGQPPHRLLAELIDLLPAYDLRVQSLTLSADGTFALEGAALSSETAANLADALTGRGWTVQTAPAPAPSALSDYPYSFSLKGDLAP